MKLIVGLGNPGIEYQFTPHNMGFLAVDRIAEQCGVRVNNRHCRAQTARTRLAGHEVVLAKPETFMNLSGASVSELVREYEAQAGAGSGAALRRAGSAVRHVAGAAAGPLGGTQRRGVGDWRAGYAGDSRASGMGVGPDHPVGDGARYVLSQFKKAQLEVVDEVLDQAAEAVRVILADGVQAAMNRFNRKPEEAARDQRPVVRG